MLCGLPAKQSHDARRPFTNVPFTPILKTLQHFPKTKLTEHFNMSMTPLIFLNQLPQQPSLSTRHDHWMTDKMTF